MPRTALDQGDYSVTPRSSSGPFDLLTLSVSIVLGSLGVLGISHPYLLLFHVQRLSWSVETPLVSSLLLTSLHQPQQPLLLRGLAPRTLTWEDELLLIFVVVGGLQKTENTA